MQSRLQASDGKKSTMSPNEEWKRWSEGDDVNFSFDQGTDLWRYLWDINWPLNFKLYACETLKEKYLIKFTWRLNEDSHIYGIYFVKWKKLSINSYAS